MHIKHFAASDVTYYCTSQNSKPKEEAQDPESTLAGLLVLLRIIGPEASKTSVHPSFSTKEGCLCKWNKGHRGYPASLQTQWWSNSVGGSITDAIPRGIDWRTASGPFRSGKHIPEICSETVAWESCELHRVVWSAGGRWREQHQLRIRVSDPGGNKDSDAFQNVTQTKSCNWIREKIFLYHKQKRSLPNPVFPHIVNLE